MGFRPEPTTFNLTFDGTPLEGLQIKATCCTVAEYRRILQIAASSGGTITEQDIKDNDWVLELFAENLREWNLDDPRTGQPVSADIEGLNSQEHRFVVMMITAWQTALVSVPTTSSTESDSGASSEEATLGLASLSENLQS